MTNYQEETKLPQYNFSVLSSAPFSPSAGQRTIANCLTGNAGIQRLKINKVIRKKAAVGPYFGLMFSDLLKIFTPDD